MSFINDMPVEETSGRVLMVEGTAESDDPFIGGVRFWDNYDPGLAYVTTVDTVPGTATYQDGIARNAAGSMYALVDSPPLEADRCYVNGILLDTDGQICLTIDNPIANWVHGWPVDDIGQLCVTGITAPTPSPSGDDRITSGGDLRITADGAFRTTA